MAITYIWSITNLNCYPEVEGETNVVFTSYWELSGTDGQYAGKIYGSTPLTYVAGTPFTPYDQLTEEQVINWTKNAIGPDGLANYELVVEKQIQDQINPPTISLPLPWAG